ALHSLWAIKEGWGSGDHEVQPRESPAVNFVNQLSECVQALLPHVTSYPLQSLDLVQHQHETCVARIAQYYEKTLQETQCSEVVDVALHPGRPLDACAHIRLAGEPGQ